MSNNGYIFVDDPAKSAAIFARLRNGGKYWTHLPLPAVNSGGSSTAAPAAAAGVPDASCGGLEIVGIRDLTSTEACPKGKDTSQPDGLPSLPVSSSGNMITYRLGNGAEVTLRTSECPIL